MTYRLIHDDTNAYNLFPAVGNTSSKHTIFEGDLDDCAAEVTRLNLTTTDEIDEMLNSTQSLAQAKANKIVQIADQRYAVESGGVTYTENDTDYIIRSDRDDVSRLKETTDEIIAGNITSIDWKCKNDLWLNINNTNVAAIKTAMLTHISTCFAAEKAAQEAINALTTVEEVNAYTFTIG